jgi:hypothetical protein
MMGHSRGRKWSKYAIARRPSRASNVFRMGKVLLTITKESMMQSATHIQLLLMVCEKLLHFYPFHVAGEQKIV